MNRKTAHTKCRKIGLWILLILPFLLVVVSTEAQSNSATEVQSFEKPVPFNFGKEDLSRAMGKRFDKIHVISDIRPYEIVVGATTFDLSPGVVQSDLRKGMFVGIKLNDSKDTVVAIEPVGKPNWWGKR